jgi:hypothetical protein
MGEALHNGLLDSQCIDVEEVDVVDIAVDMVDVAVVAVVESLGEAEGYWMVGQCQWVRARKGCMSKRCVKTGWV